MNIGELVYIQGLYLFRNQHAYLVFKKVDSSEYFGDILYFNEQYYCIEALPDLRAYKLEDFL